MEDIDSVFSNFQFARQEVLLHLLEDNEVAIKSLRLLRFCVMSRKGSSTSGIQRSLEEKD